MKNSKLLILTLFGLLFFFSVSIKAQDDLSENQLKQPVRRGNLMRSLGLSQEQIQQIRQLNAATKPLEREAKQRLNDARKNLDNAVYADSLNESDVRAKTLELQQAQANLIELKASNELAIRKILTAEQLTKFRELRDQFKENREERIEQRSNRRKNAPNRRRERQRP